MIDSLSLSLSLTKMYDMGIRKRQLKRWSARKPFCPKKILVAEPLSIQEAIPAFVFLSISILLTIAICILENFVNWVLLTRWATKMSSD